MQLNTRQISGSGGRLKKCRMCVYRVYVCSFTCKLLCVDYSVCTVIAAVVAIEFRQKAASQSNFGFFCFKKTLKVQKVLLLNRKNLLTNFL